MNRIFKIVFNHVLGRHVVVSELASSIQRGACKAVVAAVLAVAGAGISSQAYANESAGSLHFGNGAGDYGKSYDAGMDLSAVTTTDAEGTEATGLGFSMVRGDGMTSVVAGDAGNRNYIITSTGEEGEDATFYVHEVTGTSGNNVNYGTSIKSGNADDIKGYLSKGYFTSSAMEAYLVQSGWESDDVTALKLPNEGYAFTVIDAAATASFTRTLEKEIETQVIEKIGTVVEAGDNVNIASNTTTKYYDAGGNELTATKNEDGSISYTDAEGNAYTGEVKTTEVITSYTVNAADSQTSVSEGTTDEATGTTTYKVTQNIASKDDDGNITYAKTEVDITDTNTTYGLSGTAGSNSATVNLTSKGGEPGDAGAVTIQGGENVTVSASEDGKTITIAAETGSGDAIHYYSTNDGGTQQGNYDNKGATGSNTTAAGVSASAAGNNGTAVGAQANAAGNNAVALGVASNAAQENAVAIGVQANSGGTHAIAMGTAAQATADNAMAIGTQSNAAAGNTMALGTTATATQENAMAIGVGANASGQNAMALGVTAKATQQAAVATGVASQASGLGSSAYGTEAKALGDHSVAFGASTSAAGLASTALGTGATTTVGNATAVGAESSVTALGGVALGWNSVASTAAGEVGVDLSGEGHSEDTTGTWKSTYGAVSVGGGEGKNGLVTRQITNVAAGTQDTDAVNVAQLRSVQTHYYSVDSTQTGAGSNYNNDGADGNNALAAGVSASAKGIDATAIGSGAFAGNTNPDEFGLLKNATAVGANSKADGERATAIGESAYAQGMDAIAIGGTDNGEGKGAIGTNAIAIGAQADARGYNTIAIGGYTVTDGEDVTVLGSGAWGMADYATAVGDRAQAVGTWSSATGAYSGANEYSVAIGGYAQAGTTVEQGIVSPIEGKTGATAIGYSSKATGQYSSAVGSYSNATADWAISHGTSSNASGYGATALGGGSQATDTYTTAVGLSASASGKNATALGASAKASADNALAAGVNAKAEGESSIAIGNAANAKSANTIAIGNGVSVEGEKSLAIGYGHQVKGEGNAVIGDPNTVTGANNQVLANNSTVTGDSNVAIGNKVTVEAKDGVAVGSGSQVSVDGGVALGNGSVASTDAGEVGYDPSTGAPSAETGSAWVSTAAAVAVGDGSEVTRQITGVAAGTKDTDAVNVAQLKNAGSSIEFNGDAGDTISKPKEVNIVGGITDESKLSSEDNIGVVATKSENGGQLKVRLAKDIKGVDTVTVNKSVTVGNTTINKDGMTIKGGPQITKNNVSMGGQQIHNVARGTAPTDAVNVSQLKDTESRLGKRIGAVREDANAGVAMALAAASLPQAYLPGKSMMAMAAGTYLGEQGYAIGFSTVSDNGKWIFKANASGNSQGHYGAAVGAGYQW